MKAVIPILIALSLLQSRSFAEARPAGDARIVAILQAHCIGCHGPQSQEGNLRIDQLHRDFVAGGDADKWQEVLNQIAAGIMPPSDAKPLSTEQRQTLTTWLRSGLESAAAAKRAGGGSVMLRRLTKEEYQHTMEDLLGLQIDFTSDLPPDPPSKDGFLNNGETLLMSASQMETYLETARRALDKSLDVRAADKSVHYIFTAKEPNSGDSVTTTPPDAIQERRVAPKKPFVRIHSKTTRDSFSGPVPLSPIDSNEPESDKTFGAWSFPATPIKPGYVQVCGLDEWPTSGEVLVRVRVAGDGRKAAMTVAMGYRASEQIVEAKAIGSAIVGNEEVFEYRVRMDSVPLVPPNGKPKFAAELLLINNNSLTAHLHVKSVEITTLPPKPIVEHAVLGLTPEATLRKFVPRAWRRPATEPEMQQLLKLHSTLAETMPATALRDTLAVVLSSANFLYLLEPRAEGSATTLTEHELAARLSYLLWSTMPDDELRGLADAGTLRDQLERQFNRMLDDRRSNRFVRGFVYQWLDLGGLERVAVNPEYFKDYTDEVKADSANETYAFFDYVLRHDLPATALIKSDFVIVNDRLARHYGMTDVSGSEFRAVPAPPHRGGLPTQASILTANSNGVDSHPIKRGTWILLRLLNDPPPPPPPNVPMLDEAKAEAKGLTIAQQLAEHRNNPACADCHQKIDPWGLSLENFNAVGLWRNMPTTQPAAVVAKPSAKRQAVQAKADEANANRAKIEIASPAVSTPTPVEELQRRLLIERGDDFAEALVSKLLTYALGRSLDYADAAAVDELTAGFKADEYDIRLLIKNIVLSDAFQRRN